MRLSNLHARAGYAKSRRARNPTRMSLKRARRSSCPGNQSQSDGNFWMESADMPTELESNTYRWLHLGSSFQKGRPNAVQRKPLIAFQC
jgi:hypothetical protein